MRGDHKKARITGIDLIRAISILYIVGYWHLLNYTRASSGYMNLVTYRVTVIALGLFVFISGYLIGTKGVSSGKGDISRFYVKRLLRIYPPFLLAIVLFYRLGLSDGRSLFKSAFLVSMFSRPVPETLWFVTMIIFFYILAPILINFSTSLIKYFFLCAGVMMSILLYNHFFLIADVRVAIYFPSFALGILMSRRRPLFDGVKTSIIVLLFTISAAISFNNFGPVETNFLSIPLAISGSMLVFRVAMKREKDMGYHAIAGFLSYASFFMYLFHRPAFLILTFLYFPTSGPSQILYLYAICLPFIIIASWSMQKIYDWLVFQLISGWTRMADCRTNLAK